MSKTVQIVCPVCQAVNRLPVSRNARKAKCGKCKMDLFTGSPIELTDINFSRMIVKSDIPVVVDFWAPWCGPCKMMGPEFAKAAAALEPQIRFAKLNTQDHQMIAQRYNISGIPNIILFKGGKPAAQKAGAMPARDIEAWLLSNL